MEFDLEAFTADVDAALGYASPYLLSETGREPRGDSGKSHGDMACFGLVESIDLTHDDGFGSAVQDVHEEGTGDRNRFKRRKIDRSEDRLEEEESESETDEEDEIALLLHPGMAFSLIIRALSTCFVLSSY